MKNIYNVCKLFNNYKFIKNTPLIYNERLSKLYNCNIYLKREDLQTTRSFKLRGSFNKINNIINNNFYNNIEFSTASAGNHAQGVGYICDYYNIKCNIFVPKNTPQQKINSIMKYKNVKLITYGDTFDDSLKECLYYVNKSSNNFFIHPFDDMNIIHGQGTIMYEILNQLNKYNIRKPDIVCSTIGGGGLMSGLITAYNEIFDKQNTFNNSNKSNKTNFIGCQSYYSATMFESIKNNKIIENNNIDTFVDGASVKRVGDLTYDIIKNNIYKIYKIKNEDLCNDLIDLYQHDGIITELAGTLSISVLKHLDKNYIKNKNIVCIISGGNNDIYRLNEFINMCKYK